MIGLAFTLSPFISPLCRLCSFIVSSSVMRWEKWREEIQGWVEEECKIVRGEAGRGDNDRWERKFDVGSESVGVLLGELKDQC